MRRSLLVLVLLLLAGVTVALAWWYVHSQRHRPPPELALYGNIDLRQVQLAFNNSERISAVLVQEGDRVEQGQVMARLDTSRLQPQVAQAEAMAGAQRQVYERLKNGSRPEEIAQARANVDLAKADAVNSRQLYERYRSLIGERAVSRQELDNAKAAMDVADAKLVVSQKALDLVLAGPRVEEVAEAEARWHAAEAQLAFLRQQLADAVLVAPLNAVIRTRLLEPGDMGTPQKPVFTLAITDPKWVRAYVSEPDLGKVRPGMAASVVVDSFPDRRFEGWIGFISPVAEFTPRTVQTDELRTSLVYEARVFVKDPSDQLRLGMPATVFLPVEPKQ